MLELRRSGILLRLFERSNPGLILWESCMTPLAKEPWSSAGRDSGSFRSQKIPLVKRWQFLDLSSDVIAFSRRERELGSDYW